MHTNSIIAVDPLVIESNKFNSDIEIYTDVEVLEALNNNNFEKYIDLINNKKYNKYFLEEAVSKELRELEKKKVEFENNINYEKSLKNKQFSMLMDIFCKIENLENTLKK